MEECKFRSRPVLIKRSSYSLSVNLSRAFPSSSSSLRFAVIQPMWRRSYTTQLHPWVLPNQRNISWKLYRKFPHRSKLTEIGIYSDQAVLSSLTLRSYSSLSSMAQPHPFPKPLSSAQASENRSLDVGSGWLRKGGEYPLLPTERHSENDSHCCQGQWSLSMEEVGVTAPISNSNKGWDLSRCLWVKGRVGRGASVRMSSWVRAGHGEKEEEGQLRA